jgi:hypothetical protein
LYKSHVRIANNAVLSRVLAAHYRLGSGEGDGEPSGLSFALRSGLVQSDLFSQIHY